MTASTHVGGTCAVLTCEKIILLSSRHYCDEHSALEPTAASRDPSATNMAKGFQPSNRSFVAKRGRGKFMFTPSRHFSRQDPPSQDASSPDTSAPVTQSPKANEQEAPPSSLVRDNSIDTNDISLHLRLERNGTSHVGSTPNSAQIKAAQDVAKADKGSSASQVNSHTVSNPKTRLEMELQAETEEVINQPLGLDSATKKLSSCSNIGSETLPTEDLKMDAHQNGQSVHATDGQHLAGTAQAASEGAPSNEGFKKTEPSLGLDSQPRVPSTAPVNRMQFTSEDGVKFKSSPRTSKPKKDNTQKHLEHHYPETRTSSKAKLLSTPTKRSAPLTSKGLPVRKQQFQGSLPEVSAEIDDEVNMADVSDIDGEAKPAKSVPLSFRAKAEARKKRLLVEFDSEAFDSLIYRQSSLQPPPYVTVSSRIVKYNPVFGDQKPLYLPVNPAIHHMHKRSRSWYRKKCDEIRRRPKRKEWFGKVVERQRWLQALEMKQQEKIKQAQQDGTTPPYRPPKPRGVKRILDFGDLPEEELPEYVRSNPAWLKACAWFRECEDKATARQRHVNNKTKETESYFQSLNA
ncbi:uncharacterized protein FOBCDRAFT_34479 [Fusarium oxysporum Fo47]|uniref:Uncharacterized protein n=3 Tax=Fusarium oxysporum TaxID=5507 RepID=W9JYH7_FUSOX|nr:uncharacterized protein FOBCDRAFT_34479 [Fusarium oxysporum Fo47]KAH7481057.1 hypothetical protein FOMA001_g8448 [Fusarium oxysporum f. sp. matthiolae]RKK63223.1 hypothetical protein BFJ66_g435 [Fusarium oxysporum f. sp. cepae]EWZ37134.1 hypothetical protein FOZG_10970 [Fusarium oxysporum Fo47]EWZ37135.1 hypothetical protein FOZG_10970 [Fusarium oxysporum Fo47]EWZ37136.1 hypothetical protein FOZG_10970 [Fusarium oxysporum Fo47]